jgi:hypothetical protein
MDGTDESATSTTDHAITNFPAHIKDVGGVVECGLRAAILEQGVWKRKRGANGRIQPVTSLAATKQPVLEAQPRPSSTLCLKVQIVEVAK